MMLCALFAITACASHPASEGGPPTCARAYGHFYAAGCAYFDGGRIIPLEQVVAACDGWMTIPAHCQDLLDAFLGCIDVVTRTQRCDCSEEEATLLTCRHTPDAIFGRASSE
jgi:hypothetical protein